MQPTPTYTYLCDRCGHFFAAPIGSIERFSAAHCPDCVKGIGIAYWDDETLSAWLRGIAG